jgi:hypothetical protein
MNFAGSARTFDHWKSVNDRGRAVGAFVLFAPA